MIKNKFFLFNAIFLACLVLLSLLFNTFTVKGDLISNQPKECIASLEGFSFPFSNLASGNEIISSDACRILFEKNKQFIMKEVCLKTTELGDLNILQDSQVVFSSPIDCPESLVAEDAPATMTGEFVMLHADDFVNGKSENIPKIKDSKTNKYFQLKFKDKSVLSLDGEIIPGDIIKVRGKKSGSTFTLESKKDKYLAKLGNNAGDI